MSAPAVLMQLQALADPDYRAFHCRLIPTVPPERVLGVRTPALRRYARQLAGTPQAEDFLKALPHRYYDENNLHAFLLEQIREPMRAVAAVDGFLPFVDNWATCDMMSPPVFRRRPEELEPAVCRWLADAHPYTRRYGINCRMRYFLTDDCFSPEQAAAIAGLPTGDYYVRMGAAWYFATALAMQPRAILPYFTERLLPPEVWSPAVRKALESRRIPPAQKALLRSLR